MVDQRSFSGLLDGLFNDVVYRVRAYARNSVGIAYGETRLFSTGETAIVYDTLSSPFSYPLGLTVAVNPVTSADGRAELHLRTRALQGGYVRLTIYDPLGNILDQIESVLPNGIELHRFYWDLCDLRGRPVGSGSYLAVAEVVAADGLSAGRSRAVIGVRR